MTEVKLKVLTLNCWGIFVPMICEKKDERIAAISEELSKSDFDIVFLQEVWCHSDYVKIKNAVTKVMPYAHYYKSGIVGSGLCVYSRHEIMSTLQYRFSVNGYAHRLFCGDWYGEKSVGLAKLIVQPSGVRVNAYTTHLHANYNQKHSYDSHRCLQTFQLASFVKETSHDCDVTVLGGDFNVTTKEVGYAMITSGGGVQDSWTNQKDKHKRDHEEATCGRRDNTFYANSLETEQRIDFIFHKSNSPFSISCDVCELGMRRPVNGGMSFSDHEGVVAVYSITQTSEAERDDLQQTNNDNLLKTLTTGVTILEKGVVEGRYYRFMWFLAFVIFAFLVVATLGFQFLGLENTQEVYKHGYLSDFAIIYFKYFFIEALKLIFLLLALFSIINAGLVMTKEINNTNSVLNDMRQQMNYLKGHKKQL